MSKLIDSTGWQSLYLATLSETTSVYWREQKKQALASLLENLKPDPKRQAQAAVNKAVLNGDLPRISTRVCADCGSQAHHYHHHSYDEADWLKVTPLCRSCHRTRLPPNQWHAA